MRDEVRCTECAGTGSTHPECRTCKGMRHINVRTAYAHGWKKHDIASIYDDNRCDCPECWDEAGPCTFCYGDGWVTPLVVEQQRGRVLLAAFYGGRRTPPSFEYDKGRGLIVNRDIKVLSIEQAHQLRDEGLITWSRTMFGDMIGLTTAGQEAFKQAWKDYRLLCRRWVSDERKRRVEIELLRIHQNHPRISENEL